MTGLQVRDLVVRFGGLAALSEVSFDVPDGGVTGVIGPNGAGKTTLFNVISGFVSPTSGSMTWQGQPWKPRPDRLVHAGIARTLQGVGLFGQLSAVENVMVGAAKRRTTGFVSALLALPRSDRDEAKLRADALDALERVGAADIASTIAGTLPYPLQKKVALARALVSRPRMLMLDEPAGGLGAEDLDPLGELIRSLPSDPDYPCSVLLVEHHMDLVMSVCDSVVVLDFGKRVAWGSPAETQNDPAVAEAYLGAQPTAPVTVPTSKGDQK